MFNKLRTNTHLKAKADSNGLEVGFYGRVIRIARMHQYGLRDRVVAGGGETQYEERRVLGQRLQQVREFRNNMLQYFIL